MANYFYATTDDEAERRYLEWKSVDPFPDIPPALLNSDHICKYVEKTGMLVPFTPNKDTLKTASYELAIKGTYKYWDHRGKPVEKYINPGDELELPRNTIAFVQVEPYLRLPDYIAIRFNLRISHVYKGLLLGTGPLVDPGFEGDLFIPLHNLTYNNYTLVGGTGLIWMEFTKVSGTFSKEEVENKIIAKFPEYKKKMTLTDYLQKASPHVGIRSSIPIIGTKAADDAEAAKKEAEASKRYSQRLTWIGGISFILTLVTLTLGMFYFMSSYVDGRLGRVETRLEKVESSRKGGEPSVRNTVIIDQPQDQSIKIREIEGESPASSSDQKEDDGKEKLQLEGKKESGEEKKEEEGPREEKGVRKGG